MNAQANQVVRDQGCAKDTSACERAARQRAATRRASPAPIQTHFSSGSSLTGGATRHSARKKKRSSAEGTRTQAATPLGRTKARRQLRILVVAHGARAEADDRRLPAEGDEHGFSVRY